MSETKRNITAFEARTHLGEQLDYIRYAKKPVFIERHGKPVAVLMDIETYQQMVLPAQYRDWLSEALGQIKIYYQPEKIILFGSGSEGRIKEGSDIDLFIIKKTSKRKLDRIDEILEFLDPKNPVDIHVYTPQEIKKRLSLGDPFLKEVFAKGKVLYEKSE